MRSTPPLSSKIWGRESARLLERYLVGDSFKLEEFHTVAKDLRWAIGFAINVLCYAESTGDLEAIKTSDDVWIWRRVDNVKTIKVRLFKMSEKPSNDRPRETKGFTVDAIDFDAAKRLARTRVEKDFGGIVRTISITVAGEVSITFADREPAAAKVRAS